MRRVPILRPFPQRSPKSPPRLHCSTTNPFRGRCDQSAGVSVPQFSRIALNGLLPCRRVRPALPFNRRPSRGSEPRRPRVPPSQGTKESKNGTLGPKSSRQRQSLTTRAGFYGLAREVPVDFLS